MSTYEFPRVLFVTPAAFNRVTGGGITFSNLFAGWPNDRLATVHNDPVPVSSDVCDRYYRLGFPEIRAFGPLQRLRESTSAVISPNSETSSPQTRRRKLLAAKRMLFGESLPERGRLSPDLHSWISDFRPDVMYTILGSNGLIEVAQEIHCRFNLPYIVHFMDDWIEAHHRTGLLSWFERRRMLKLVRQAVAGASQRLAICDDMAEEYGSRWKVPFSVFQNTVDTSRCRGTHKMTLAAHRPARLLYTGSILPFAQLDALETCCRAVAQLNAEGKDIRLDIRTPNFMADPVRRRLEIHPSIQIQPPLTDDGLYFSALSEADALLLPANFDRDSVTFIRYSMPTKVPPYLASGTPILMFGPARIAQVEYARRFGWAHVVDNPGIKDAADGIMEILENLALREHLSRSARHVASERHDSSLVRRGFHNVLRAAAGRSACI